MRIEAYLLCWNEIDIMPLVIKHYQKFCDKITICDNWSTDGSAELAVSLGCRVIPFGTQFFDDEENMRCKNEVWKGSKADWVIVADFDEALFDGIGSMDGYSVEAIRYKLTIEVGITTIFKTRGWQIMSDEWPAKYLTQITNGYEFKNYAKSIIFSPLHITDISYGPGAHEANPQGVVRWSDDSLFVLHYKHIGGVQRTIDRYKQYQKRMSKNNRKNGWGIHYNRSPASLRQEWNERMKISKPLI